MRSKINLIVVLTISTFLALPVGAISDEQKQMIVQNCDAIKEQLKTVQHADSRARVYLGRHYETILSKFMIPLNMRLVENSLSDNDLIDNQNSFTKMRNNFTIDFVEYQKKLEDLMATDCKSAPGEFYEKLVVVREKREMVANDTEKMKQLVDTQLKLVDALKGRI